MLDKNLQTSQGFREKDECPRCHKETLILNASNESLYCPGCRWQDQVADATEFGEPVSMPDDEAAAELLGSRLPFPEVAESVVMSGLMEETGIDIHDLVQQGFYGKNYTKESTEQRQMAKSLVFGWMFNKSNMPLWVKHLAEMGQPSDCLKPASQMFPTADSIESDREVHPTGAVRSSDTNGFAFDLLSPVATLARAGVMAEGADKYARGNYLKGFTFSSIYQHLMMHLQMWLLGDTTEEHLTHAQWNLDALIHFSVTRTDLDDRIDYGLTAEHIAEIKRRFRFVKKEPAPCPAPVPASSVSSPESSSSSP